MNNKISAIICTYNPDVEKLKKVVVYALKRFDEVILVNDYSDDMHNAWCTTVMKAADRLYEIGMRGDAKSLLAWLTHRGKWSAHKQPEAKNELTQALLEKIIDKL